MERIKIIESRDQASRLEFFRSSTGLVNFEASEQAWEDIPDYGRNEYWSIKYTSGLHGSLADAEKEARRAVRWLGEQA